MRALICLKTSVVCAHLIPWERRTRIVADPKYNSGSLLSISSFFRRDLLLTLYVIIKAGPIYVFFSPPFKADTNDQSWKRKRGCGGGKLGNKWNTLILLMTYIVLIKLFGCSQTSAFVRLICTSRLLPICDQQVKLHERKPWCDFCVRVFKNLIENVMCSWLEHLQPKVFFSGTTLRVHGCGNTS